MEKQILPLRRVVSLLAILLAFICGFVFTDSSVYKASLPVDENAPDQSVLVIPDEELDSCPALNGDPEIAASLDAMLAAFEAEPAPTLVEQAAANPILENQSFGISEDADLSNHETQQSLLAQIKETYRKDAWDLSTLKFNQELSIISTTEFPEETQILYFDQYAATEGGDEVPVDGGYVALMHTVFGDDTLVDRYATGILPQKTGVTAEYAFGMAEQKTDGELQWSAETRKSIATTTYLPVEAEVGDGFSSHSLVYKLDYTNDTTAKDPSGASLAGKVVYVDAATGDQLFVEDTTKGYRINPVPPPPTYGGLPYYISNPEQDCAIAAERFPNRCQHQTGSECDASIGPMVPLNPNTSLPGPFFTLTTGTGGVTVGSDEETILPSPVTIDFLHQAKPYNYAPNSERDWGGKPFIADSYCVSRAATSAMNRHATAMTNVYTQLTSGGLGGDYSVRYSDSDNKGLSFELARATVDRLISVNRIDYRVGTVSPNAVIYDSQEKMINVCGGKAVACTRFPSKGDPQIVLDDYSATDNEVVIHEMTHLYVKVVNPLLSISRYYEARSLEEGIADFFGISSAKWDRTGLQCTDSCAKNGTRHDYDSQYAKCQNADFTYYIPARTECDDAVTVRSWDPNLDDWVPGYNPALDRHAYGQVSKSEYDDCEAEYNKTYSGTTNPSSPEWKESAHCNNLNQFNIPLVLQDGTRDEPFYDYSVRFNQCRAQEGIPQNKCDEASGCRDGAVGAPLECHTFYDGPTGIDLYDTDAYGDYAYKKWNKQPIPVRILYNSNVAGETPPYKYVPFDGTITPEDQGARVAALLLQYDQTLRQMTSLKEPEYAAIIANPVIESNDDGFTFKRYVVPPEIETRLKAAGVYYDAIAKAVRQLSTDVVKADEYYPLIPAFYGHIASNLHGAVIRKEFPQLMYDKFVDAVYDAGAGLVVGNTQWVQSSKVIEFSGICPARVLEPLDTVNLSFIGVSALAKEIQLDFLNDTSGAILDRRTIAVAQKELGKPSTVKATIPIQFEHPANIKMTIKDITGRTNVSYLRGLDGHEYFVPTSPWTCLNGSTLSVRKTGTNDPYREPQTAPNAAATHAMLMQATGYPGEAYRYVSQEENFSNTALSVMNATMRALNPSYVPTFLVKMINDNKSLQQALLAVENFSSAQRVSSAIQLAAADQYPNYVCNQYRPESNERETCIISYQQAVSEYKTREIARKDFMDNCKNFRALPPDTQKRHLIDLNPEYLSCAYPSELRTVQAYYNGPGGEEGYLPPDLPENKVIKKIQLLLLEKNPAKPAFKKKVKHGWYYKGCDGACFTVNTRAALRTSGRFPERFPGVPEANWEQSEIVGEAAVENAKLAVDGLMIATGSMQARAIKEAASGRVLGSMLGGLGGESSANAIQLVEREVLEKAASLYRAMDDVMKGMQGPLKGLVKKKTTALDALISQSTKYQEQIRIHESIGNKAIAQASRLKLKDIIVAIDKATKELNELSTLARELAPSTGAAEKAVGKAASENTVRESTAEILRTREFYVKPGEPIRDVVPDILQCREFVPLKPTLPKVPEKLHCKEVPVARGPAAEPLKKVMQNVLASQRQLIDAGEVVARNRRTLVDNVLTAALRDGESGGIGIGPTGNKSTGVLSVFDETTGEIMAVGNPQYIPGDPYGSNVGLRLKEPYLRSVFGVKSIIIKNPLNKAENVTINVLEDTIAFPELIIPASDVQDILLQSLRAARKSIAVKHNTSIIGQLSRMPGLTVEGTNYIQQGVNGLMSIPIVIEGKSGQIVALGKYTEHATDFIRPQSFDDLLEGFYKAEITFEVNIEYDVAKDTASTTFRLKGLTMNNGALNGELKQTLEEAIRLAKPSFDRVERIGG